MGHKEFSQKRRNQGDVKTRYNSEAKHAPRLRRIGVELAMKVLNLPQDGASMPEKNVTDRSEENALSFALKQFHLQGLLQAANLVRNVRLGRG